MPSSFSRSTVALISFALLSLSLPAPADQTWHGGSDNQWTTPGNWSGNALPGASDVAIYNNTSSANLSNWLGQSFSLKGLLLSNPPAPVSINGAGPLALGASGINLSNATQPLSVTAPVSVGGNQSWVVAPSQTLFVSGMVSGNGGIYKDGFGALYLSGTNNFTGNVTNNGGPLWINNGAALGTGTKTIYVANNLVGAGLHLEGTNGAITLASGLGFIVSQNLGAIFNEAGNNVINGAMSVFSGGGDAYLVVNADSLTLNGTISLGTSARSVKLGGAATGIANAGIISSALAFRKLDAGTWTLNGNNTFGGAASIEGGTLVLGPNAKMGSTPSITVFGNALLDVSAVVTGGSNAFVLTANQVLAGGGTVTGNVATAASATVQPGGSGAAGTLSLSNNFSLGPTVTNFFELNTDPTPGSLNDLINVAGALDPQNARIWITPLSVLSAGVPYRLFKYGGPKPSAFNATVLTDSRYGFMLDESVTNEIDVTVTGTVISNLVWHASSSSGVWDVNTTANWNNNTLTFYNSDPVTFDDTAATNVVTLSGALRPVSVTLSNDTVNYSFQGASPNKITGPTGLTKTGAANLTNNASACDFTGPVTISGGVLSVSNMVNNGSASVLGAGTTIVLNGGTFQYTGAKVEVNRFFALSGTGGTVESIGSGVLFITNTISGPASASLTKIGAKQLIIGDTSGAGGVSIAGSNTYDGVTFINQGEVQIRNASALGSTAGKTVVANGADLAVGGGADLGVIYESIDLNGGDGNVSAGTLQVNDASSKANFGGTINLLGSSSVGTVNNGNKVTFVISGLVTGPGALKKLGTNSVILTCSSNDYSGGTLISSGTLQSGNGDTAGALGSGPVTNNAALVFNHTDSTTNSAGISGTGTLTHTGAGTLMLSGNCTYTGATTVNGGVVLVNGTLGPGVVTVAANGALGGYGFITGPLTVNSGGTLALGAEIGILTASSNLTLNGTTVMKLSKNGLALANDLIQGINTLSNGGTLTVIASGDPLQAGDSFRLFSAANYARTFAVLNLPSLDPGLSWDSSGLATNGTIQVASRPAVVVTPPQPIVECGGALMLAAAASGVPAPGLQWYDNLGVPIPDATNSTLTLDPVHLAQSGTWSVVASNYVGRATNTASVTVRDTTPPMIALQGASSMTIECHDSFTVPGASANDICAGAVSVTTTGEVNTNQTGSYTLTYAALDGNGNSNLVTRTVKVVDTTAPAITWSFTNLTLNAGTDCQALMPDATGTNYILAVDACSSSLLITQSPTNGTPLALGTNEIVLTAADSATNLAYSTNWIVVVDATPPEITWSFTNLTLNAGANCQVLMPDVTGTNYVLATDACSSLLLITQDPTNGTPLALGTNEIVLTVADSATNLTHSTNWIVVVDATPPEITWSFTNLTLNADANCQALMPDLTGTNYILAIDTCSGSLLITQSPTNGTPLNLGTNEVVLAVADSATNLAYSTNWIVVLDVTPPSITCPADLSIITSDPAGTFASFTVTATDACDPNPVVVSTPASGSFFPAGTNTVFCTATDSSGNTNSCAFSVFVDRTPVALTNLSAYLVQDQALTLTFTQLLAVISDPDSDPLTVVGADSASANGGSVILTSTNLTYQPASGFVGSDSFAYVVGDGRGGFGTNAVLATALSRAAVAPGLAFGPQLQDGMFVVRFAAFPGFTYTIEAADDQGSPVWSKQVNLTAPLTDEGLGAGVFEFSADVSTAPQRFYRAVYPAY